MHHRWVWGGLLLLSVVTTSVGAEPYLAVRTGQKCMACHVNPTGGGLRTAYGLLFAQNQLAVRTVSDPENAWIGQLTKHVAVGGDLRSNLNIVSTPGQSDELAFDLQSAQIYVNVEIIPGQLSFYLDEHVAPGNSVNREAYALWWLNGRNNYLKIGRLFLPYGIRLEDDTAFIREVTGINFNALDDGVEAGLEYNLWSINLAVTNGTGGNDETNRKKQISLRAERVQPQWRAGVSFNRNEGINDNKRRMFNTFGGLRTGPLAWLAEINVIHDDTAGESTVEQEIRFLESNYELKKGHNLKLSLEYHDPNRDVKDNARRRTSLLWEYTPIEFVQIRTGYRHYDSREDNPVDEREVLFIQLHSFF